MDMDCEPRRRRTVPRRRSRAWAWGLGALLSLTACSVGGGDDSEGTATSDAPSPAASPDLPPASRPSSPSPATSDSAPAEGASIDPIGLELSEGAPVAQPPAARVEGSALTDEEVAAILGRLPEWVLPGGDGQDLNLPAESLPPPQAGDRIDQPFPAVGDERPPETERGPLEVLRYQPEGDVELAPFLSVTFNQPMVPLGTLDQLDDRDVPIVVEPAIEGRWRWIGTRTLRFEVEPGDTDRLPQATDYTVTVPAGTTSETGGSLDAPFSWRFSTPAATVERVTPEHDALPLEPVWIVEFDQLIDPADVLPTIRLTAGDDDVELRLATDEEIDADDEVSGRRDQALPGRWLAVTPTSPLAPDTALRLVVGPDTPSLEGPRLSADEQTYRMRTFAPLRVEETTCGWGDDCEPGMSWTIRFNNPLDPSAFTDELISIDPELPGANVNVVDSFMEIGGASTGQTTYTVTLAADVVDVYGQTLGEPTDVQIDVGPASPALIGFDRSFITLDPAAPAPAVSVTSINHDSLRAEAWRITPEQYPEYAEYLEATYSDLEPAVPDWPQVLDDEIEVDAADDRYVETDVDLSSALEAPGDLAVVRISPTVTFDDSDDEYWRNRPTVALVQSTALGVDAMVSNREVLVWTTDLLSGAPVGGVDVEVLGRDRTVTTDDDGLATVSLAEGRVLGLVGRTGDDVSLLPSDWYQGWEEWTTDDETRWYVFDDQGVYRPGDTARLTGWVRDFTTSTDAQLALPAGSDTVQYQVSDPLGEEIDAGEAPLNDLGGFNFSVDIPAGANLGEAWVELRIGTPESGRVTGRSIRIQEFRVPEFEVTARHESPAPYYAVEPAVVAVDAAYYAGGPLPNADVDWTVTSSTTNYVPPGWDDYTFGIWQPWWWFAEPAFVDTGFGVDVAAEEICFDVCPPGFEEPVVHEFSGVTDAQGSHYLQMEFDSPEEDQPANVSAVATVYDVNRQAWSSTTDVLVHPARAYVGIKTDGTFVEPGETLTVEAIRVDVDGATAGGEVTIEIGRIEERFEDGEWTEEIVDPTTCAVATADDQPAVCEVNPEIPGAYRVTATTVDRDGRSNRAELTRWVSGESPEPTRDVERDEVTIIPNAETYQPGERAELLVQAPFAPASGRYTVLRNGIVTTEVFDAPDGSAVLEIPIEDPYIPNVTVQVDMTGSAPRTDDDGEPIEGAADRPAYATGSIELSIPPIPRTLSVDVAPAAARTDPGAATSATITVTDPTGAPLENADVAVLAVDEAVLSLTGYDIGDPIDAFYANVWSEVSTAYARQSIVLGRTDQLPDELASGGEVADTEAMEATPAAGDGVEELPAEEATSADAGRDSAQAPIELRSDFTTVALYETDLRTAADGTVTVDVELPDNLTRYRLMAVAVQGADRFGKGESTITARLPLMARPSAPRFLNYGDAFELPVVVQNQTDEAMEVDVAIEAANLRLPAGAGRRVTVPADDRVEVRFPATTEAVGIARFRVAATSGDRADAAEIELPVYTPATSEAFATYGVVDEGAIVQPVLPPADVYPQFGGLEISTSSTAVQSLTDAVLYLEDYPYATPDGLASRIIAIASLRDILDAFSAAELPPPDEIDARMAADIARLASTQNDDGGWAWSRRGEPSEAFVTVDVTQALVAADAAGYDVPDDTLDRALGFLAEIEQHYPRWYGDEVRDTISAFALDVRNRAGDRDAAKAVELYDRAGDELQLDAIAWLWPVLDDPSLDAEIERTFQNAAIETPGAATFSADYGEDAYVVAYSDRRTDAIILDALIGERPDSDLIPKIVNGLLANRVGNTGRWNNAYENSFILLAMNRYFQTFEDDAPDFVARVWLGEQYVAEHPYAGRTTDSNDTVVPMAELVDGGEPSDVVLQRDGAGRLYYRLGIDYAPDDLQLDPRDEGFVVDRVYEAVDDPADVARNDDGTWRIRVGATVRVRLTMVADARRTNLALVDPLPAGLEPLNGSFANMSPPPDDPGDDPADLAASWCWCWRWFEHENLRDDRAEAYATYLGAGTYEYTYTARATTPGTFVVPPAKAEEIYAPEVFGRTASATVVVAE